MAKETEKLATEAFDEESIAPDDSSINVVLPEEPVEVLISSIYLGSMSNEKLLDLYAKINSHLSYLDSKKIKNEENT